MRTISIGLMCIAAASIVLIQNKRADERKLAEQNAPRQPIERFMSYKCGEEYVNTRESKDKIFIFLGETNGAPMSLVRKRNNPDRSIQPAISGQRVVNYVAFDDEKTSFSKISGKATLVVAGKTYPECVMKKPNDMHRPMPTPSAPAKAQ